MKIIKDNRDRQINKLKTVKKRIVLCDTLCTVQQQRLKFDNRHMGKYRKIPAYTVCLDGSVIQHFDTDYYSDYLDVEVLDMENIYIELENVGWLEEDKGTGYFYSWDERQYFGRVQERLWRSKQYWATYTRKQMISLSDVLDYLFNKHEKINRLFTADNVKMANVNEIEGVVCLANYAKTFLSPNPTFDFEFVNKEIVNKTEYEEQ